MRNSENSSNVILNEQIRTIIGQQSPSLLLIDLGGDVLEVVAYIDDIHIIDEEYQRLLFAFQVITTDRNEVALARLIPHSDGVVRKVRRERILMVDTPVSYLSEALMNIVAEHLEGNQPTSGSTH